MNALLRFDNDCLAAEETEFVQMWNWVVKIKEKVSLVLKSTKMIDKKA